MKHCHHCQAAPRTTNFRRLMVSGDRQAECNGGRKLDPRGGRAGSVRAVRGPSGPTRFEETVFVADPIANVTPASLLKIEYFTILPEVSLFH